MHPALSSETSGSAIPVHLVRRPEWEAERKRLPAPLVRFAELQGFAGGEGECVLAPGSDGGLIAVLFGLGDNSDPRMLVALGARLPAGEYVLAGDGAGIPIEQAAAMFADGAYRFTRYQPRRTPAPRLHIPAGEKADDIVAQAVAGDLLRDLVNTPAEEMGPQALEDAVRRLAGAHGGQVSVIVGDDLRRANYPLVHAVGRAGPQAPRMIEMHWGEPGRPVLALVGKGVSFDTGGLNLKAGNSMRDMKKDMGGAAHAIALASLVMGARLPVRLVLLVPAVENSVSAQSFRPGDVFASRKGLKVEIDNTDAEGRLILADALARACEQDPDLVIDYATLTGAARVALGADLAPYYTDDPDLAAGMEIAGLQTGDPVWRMPLWKPYLAELKGSVCDLVNAGGPQAGSITAALFLQQFVTTRRWIHLDVWAWRQARYGRPAGAAACGLRAGWQLLKGRYGA